MFFRKKSKKKAKPVTKEIVEITAPTGQQKQPMCQIYDGLLQKGLMESLGLERETYTPSFTRLRDYWDETSVGQQYFLCAVLQLKDILKTPEDWEEIGRYLADATEIVYSNGSHQFVENAVPALIDGGLVRTKEELKQGIDLLANIGGAVSGERRMYDCGKDFGTIAYKIKNGQITSLEQVRQLYPV